MVVCRRPRPSLPRIELTCVSTVFSVTHSSLRDPCVGPAFGHQPEHFALARCQAAERLVVAFRARAASSRLPGRVLSRRGDALGCFEEFVDVEHPVLQQVAESRRPSRRARLRAGSRCAATARAPPSRDARAGSRRRPASLRRRRWAACARRRSRGRARARRRRRAAPRRRRRGDDLVAGVLEQAGEPLAQEHGVLGDHDSHGSVNLDARARTARARDPEGAAVRGDRSREPGEPRAAAGALRRRRRRRRR